jgi:DNA-binding GntR family transcriptional regulator
MANDRQSMQRDDFAEHRLIAECALDGNADGAVQALVDHYELTAAMCMERFRQGEDAKVTSSAPGQRARR